MKKAADELKSRGINKIDILLNNAGVMAMPLTRTVDGHEMQFGTNHLGHFCFTMCVYPMLRAAPSARVVNVSSAGHAQLSRLLRLDDMDYTVRPSEYGSWSAYQQSKLCNIYFASELNKRAKERGDRVTAYSLHPGTRDIECSRTSYFIWNVLERRHV